MDQLEKIIQMVTDRVMEQLEVEPVPVKGSYSLLGESKEYIAQFYREQGFQWVPLKDYHSPHVLVISEMPLFQLTRLAQMTPMNETEEGILDRIMNQQPVIILEEGLNFNQRKVEIAKTMQVPFEKAKVTLRKWGVQFKSKADFQRIPSSLNTPDRKNKAQKKELITAAKIQNMDVQAGGTFYVDSNMIITALAKDYLRERNIQLELRDAE